MALARLGEFLTAPFRRRGNQAKELRTGDAWERCMEAFPGATELIEFRDMPNWPFGYGSVLSSKGQIPRQVRVLRCVVFQRTLFLWVKDPATGNTEFHRTELQDHIDRLFEQQRTATAQKHLNEARWFPWALNSLVPEFEVGEFAAVLKARELDWGTYLMCLCTSCVPGEITNLLDGEVLTRAKLVDIENVIEPTWSDLFTKNSSDAEVCEGVLEYLRRKGVAPQLDEAFRYPTVPWNHFFETNEPFEVYADVDITEVDLRTAFLFPSSYSSDVIEAMRQELYDPSACPVFETHRSACQLFNAHLYVFQATEGPLFCPRIPAEHTDNPIDVFLLDNGDGTWSSLVRQGATEREQMAMQLAAEYLKIDEPVREREAVQLGKNLNDYLLQINNAVQEEEPSGEEESSGGEELAEEEEDSD